MKSKIVYLLGALAALAFGSTAEASTIFQGTVNLTTNQLFDGHPAYAHDISSDNFDSQNNHSLNCCTLTFSDGSTLTGNSHADFTNGSTPQHTQPFNDNTQYIVVEKNGEADFTMSHAAHYFGFLWGSVDPFNKISFLDKDGNKIADFSGSDMPNHAGLKTAEGTFYANFTSSVAIWKIVLTSTDTAFELDNVAISAVPVPAALPLFGAALAGFGALSRRRAKAQRAA